MADILFSELGFPLVLIDPPMVTVRGHALPDVNLRDLAQAAFVALVHLPARLSGSQVRFVRKHLGLRQADLATVLNMANHSVVSQWEARGDEATGMDYNTEVVLRIWMAGKAGQGAQVLELLERELRNLQPRALAPLAVTLPRAA